MIKIIPSWITGRGCLYLDFFWARMTEDMLLHGFLVVPGDLLRP